ncbi:MAG: hypothetical protein UR60_C0017G0005 [Candidatus Moranbacteria bacterium GW2011_GWF2_34_56]|nr:MAG: hypothetical protein UR51_C0015G0035 [Candidatus Moranbacteria bacterium GW2011_GWF1_34_10]KKP64667.1 MAG: hypothetical protein UR60_C0017G0005 [Candidatus Moranbacteria bacterium GW2011_GWF2_34_56]HBI16754.1 hypothetical protein [Candidatus Moranbacteria bacterium]
MKIQNSIECIIHESASDNLIKEWRDLWVELKSKCIFNSPGWFVAANKAFAYDQIRIITLRDKNSGELLGVLPLVKVRLYGIDSYTLPGIDFVDHYSLLIKRSDDLIIQQLIKSTLSMYFVYIPGVLAETAKFLNSKNNSSSFILDDNPYIKMRDEFGVILDRRKKSRHIKRAKRDFGLIDLIIDNDKNTALENAIMIENGSSKSKKGKNIFDDKKNQAFFKELIAEINDNLFIASLLFSDKPVAYNIGFVCNGVYACSQKAHIEEYNKYRPGEVMFLKFLEMIIKNHPSEVDIGRGVDSFKMGYANAIRKLYGVVLSPSSLKRFYFIFVHRLREKTYKLLNSHSYLYRFYKNIKNTLFFY